MHKKYVTLFALALLLTGCQETSSTTNPTTPPSTSVSDSNSTPAEVDPTTIAITAEGDVTSITVGQTLKLTATVYPEGADSSVTWSSSDDEVATVSENGLVTAVNVGQVTITATSTVDTAVSGTFLLIIEEAPVVTVDPESLTITSSTTEVEIGSTISLTATVNPSEASQEVTWSTSDETIATVSPSGSVRGIAEGKVTITATSDVDATISDSVEITVITPTIDPSEDFANMDFATHDEYVNCADDTPLKIKGVVTFIEPEDEGKVNYYLQDGVDGYYVYGQDTALFPVQLGETYEVGGFKTQYATGVIELKDIEYCVVSDEKCVATTNQLTGADMLNRDASLPYYGSRSSITGTVYTKPDSYSKAYNFVITADDVEVTARINNGIISEDEFEAINTAIQNLPTGSEVTLTGLVTLYGYGTAKPQLLITSASDIVGKELTDEDKIKLASDTLTIDTIVEVTETTITLPTVSDQYPEVSISWASSDESVISASGAVTHQAKDTIVTLTATLTLGELTTTVERKVNVLASDDSVYTVVHSLDLEDAEPAANYGNSATKPSYAAADVTLGTPKMTWTLDNVLIGGDQNDVRNGTFSMRMNQYADSNIELKSDGIEFNLVEFKHAVYGSNPIGGSLLVSYSTDGGVTYKDLDDALVSVNSHSLELYRVTLPEKANRVKITSMVGGRRINIDDVRLLADE